MRRCRSGTTTRTSAHSTASSPRASWAPHPISGSSAAADAAVPTGNLLGSVDNTTFGAAYAGPSNLVGMSPQAVGNVGGSQAHLNMQPFLTLNFCIALQGIFPSARTRGECHGTTIRR